MNLKIWPLALTAATLGIANTAFAQREAPTRDDRRQQRAQESANLTPAQRTEQAEARFQQRLQSATPEQRAQMLERRAQMQERMKAQGLDPNDPNAMQQMMGGRGGNTMSTDPVQREAQWRRLMVAAGITEKNLQDDLLIYIKGEEKAREPMLALARAAAASLVRAAGATPVAVTAPATDTPEVETKITTAFEAYQSALTADKARHDKALQDLDVSTAYSASPRLKAFLGLVGMLENNAPVLTNPMTVFSTPGGGNGRGGNGRGGNAGGNNAPAAAPAPAQG